MRIEEQSKSTSDDGFSLVELLVVIVVLGILSVVVVFAVGGVTANAEESSCATDRRVLQTATEAYFAQRKTDVIPAADASLEGYENTLVAEGILRGPSELYNLDASGDMVQVVGSNCIV